MVTVDLSGTVSALERDIGRKLRIFWTNVYSTSLGIV